MLWIHPLPLATTTTARLSDGHSGTCQSVLHALELKTTSLRLHGLHISRPDPTRLSSCLSTSEGQAGFEERTAQTVRYQAMAATVAGEQAGAGRKVRMHEQGAKLVVEGECKGVDGASQSRRADRVFQATRRASTQSQRPPSTSNTIPIPLRSSFDDSNPSLDTLSPRLFPPLVRIDSLRLPCLEFPQVVSLP